ncbi:MAG TPA: endonuclease [Bdellovibrionales bacterium]|nr:endonuclease [Bdellovibrionales bacterium]
MVLNAVLLFLFSTSQPALADDVSIDATTAYYGQEFRDARVGGVRDESLIEVIREVISQRHLRHPGQMDTIGNCDTADRNCKGHVSVGYNTARSTIFGNLYLVESGGGYGVEEVYCQHIYDRSDFKKAPFPGPDVIPNHSVVNAEHTWPQSKFNRRMDSGMQKSDLHHLFPTDSEMNSTRGNFEFGDVDTPERELRCPESKIGSIKGENGRFFEPPAPHKGNVARALFYFSVRYQIPIGGRQEATLRRWTKLDPVDAEERDRNDAIQKVQGNRNPFVDYPELSDSISNF